MADEVFARAIEAMTDVQRRSADAAGKLVERLIANVDGSASHEAGDATPRASTTDDAIAGMTRLWRESLSSLAGAMGGGVETHRVEVNAPGPPASLRIDVDATGQSGSTEVWLHNPSADAFDKLRLHCGPALAHDGSVFAGDVSLDPDAFDLPARASRGVVISVDATGTDPGIYRTTVLVEGLADQWLPLEIVVPDTAA